MRLDYIDNIDCMEGLRALPADCIDLTVTSPPYDNLREYTGFSWDFEALARELFRVTKPGGVVVWVVCDATVKGSETGSSFRQALYFKDCGFNLHDTMIWRKMSPVYCKDRYTPEFEYMFIFSKGRPKTAHLIADRKNKTAGRTCNSTRRERNGVTKKTHATKIKKITGERGVRTNIWDLPPCNSSAERTGHPAQFPEQLAADHILSWSNPGDVVLDPFMGSGTTAKMAAAHGRHYIGFEISAEYCEIAAQRLQTVAAAEGEEDWLT